MPIVSFTNADAEVSLTNIFSYILGSGLVFFWKSQRNLPNGFVSLPGLALYMLNKSGNGNFR